MAKPVVDPDTGVINFPNIVFNNTNCFMRNLSKSLSDMQEIGSKNIPFKMMVIGTNSAINLNIKPTTDDPNYSNIELKNAAEDPSYTMSGYERKEDTYVNSTVYLMLQNGWTENRIYDSQNNIMCSLLLGG
jgi:hypothetical protein